MILNIFRKLSGIKIDWKPRITWSRIKTVIFLVPLLVLIWYYTHNRTQWVEIETKLKTTTTELVNEKKARENERKKALAVKKTAEKVYVTRVTDAQVEYRRSLKALEPVVKASDKTVKEYAKTSAGQSMCLDPDGMQRFWAQRRLLLAASPTTITQTP